MSIYICHIIIYVHTSVMHGSPFCHFIIIEDFSFTIFWKFSFVNVKKPTLKMPFSVYMYIFIFESLESFYFVCSFLDTKVKSVSSVPSLPSQ